MNDKSLGERQSKLQSMGLARAAVILLAAVVVGLMACATVTVKQIEFNPTLPRYRLS